jgi:hypothetical protein
MDNLDLLFGDDVINSFFLRINFAFLFKINLSICMRI